MVARKDHTVDTKRKARNRKLVTSRATTAGKHLICGFVANYNSVKGLKGRNPVKARAKATVRLARAMLAGMSRETGQPAATSTEGLAVAQEGDTQELHQVKVAFDESAMIAAISALTLGPRSVSGAKELTMCLAAVAASPATQRIATDLAEMSGVGPDPDVTRQYKDFAPYLDEHLPGWEKAMEPWQAALSIFVKDNVNHKRNYIIGAVASAAAAAKIGDLHFDEYPTGLVSIELNEENCAALVDILASAIIACANARGSKNPNLYKAEYNQAVLAAVTPDVSVALTIAVLAALWKDPTRAKPLTYAGACLKHGGFPTTKLPAPVAYRTALFEATAFVAGLPAHKKMVSALIKDPRFTAITNVESCTAAMCDKFKQLAETEKASMTPSSTQPTAVRTAAQGWDEAEDDEFFEASIRVPQGATGIQVAAAAV